MRPKYPEEALPQDVLNKASFAGSEYAWLVQDIPEVIAAARDANLISLGGQLQFRLPGGGTCECYWVNIDIEDVATDLTLSWEERVNRSAEVALRKFEALQGRFDFIAEGRSAFGLYLEALESQGHDPSDAMCFVWYVASQDDDAHSQN